MLSRPFSLPMPIMDDQDWLKLDDQLCFRLYTASRVVTRCYQPLLGALGLTYPQYLVMLVLWEANRAQQPAPTVKALGARLMLDSGTLTPLLKRLEQGGLIKRERRTEDEREVSIVLTAEGIAMRGQAATVPAELAGKLGLPLDEVIALRSMLDRLLDAAS
jgi:DNA-binding MarR family transcriptional regulator